MVDRLPWLGPALAIHLRLPVRRSCGARGGYRTMGTMRNRDGLPRDLLARSACGHDPSPSSREALDSSLRMIDGLPAQSGADECGHAGCQSLMRRGEAGEAPRHRWGMN